MVERIAPTDADIDRVFHALADATRRDIVRRTLVAEQSVSALAAGYAMSFAAVSKHVGVLVEAGLVRKRADGRERLVSAEPEAIARVREFGHHAQAGNGFIGCVARQGCGADTNG